MWDAILPLIGVVIGATLSPFVAFRFSQYKERAQEKREAYLFYIHAVSALANTAPTDAKNQDLRTANLRILIYGSGDVIEAVQRISEYGNLSNPEARSAFIEVILAMRRDVRSKSFEGQMGSLSSVVFGE